MINIQVSKSSLPYRGTLRLFLFLSFILCCLILFSLVVDPLTGFKWPSSEILLSLRLTRTLAAIMIGISLCIAGLVLQKTFANPLAEPYVIGLSGSASLCAALFIALGFYSLTPLASFVGVVCTIVLLLFFSNQKSPSQLLVIGTLINATSWSLITVLRTVVDPTSSARMQRWLVGELDYPSWWAIGGASLLLLGGLVGVWRYHLELQLLQTSREDAWRLGVDIQSLQPKILAVVGLLITSALTLDVLFPLLGMVVPLMVQRWTQKSHMVWWLSGMLGAICVVLADCLARFLLFLTHIMVPTGALLVLGASIFYLVHWLRHLRRELDNV